MAGGLVLVVASLWLLGSREPIFRISAGDPAWFVALRWRDGQGVPVLAPAVTRRWSARPDFGFVGPADPWWQEVLLLSGGRPGEMPVMLGADVEDAVVFRLALGRPPRLALGVLRALILLRILRPPTGAPATGLDDKGLRMDVMPDAANIARLLAQPRTYRPAMVNFLKYFEEARYAEPRPDAPRVSGAVAYRRYGVVAMRTVYQTGGYLAFFGQVVEVLRAASGGPSAGDWDEVAVMQYDRPEAILTMEHVPAYLAALSHRDAGLDRSLVIASTASGR